jgi:membrane-bound lytic murein transglycosylase D
MAGTTNLASIIERQEHGGFGFASANFFPEFLAALEVFDRPHQYFPGLQLDSPMEYQEIPITSATSVGYLSKDLGVDMSTLREYNYAISDRIWSGRSRLPVGYRIKVPAKGRASCDNHT